MKKFYAFLLLPFLCLTGMNSVQPLKRFGGDEAQGNFYNAKVSLLEDKSRSMSPEQAYSNYTSGKYQLLKSHKYNAGFTKSVYWLMLDLPGKGPLFNPMYLRDSLFFVVGNAHINDLRFYSVKAGKPFLKYQTGDHFKFKQRPVRCRLFVFPISESSHSGNERYLLRIDKHNESLQLSAELLNSSGFYAKVATYNLINGILSGAVLLLFIFGVFLFITVRDKLYLYYLLYLLAMCLWVAADKGYGYQYLWPESTYFASRARPVFNTLMSVAALQFMQSFLGQTIKNRLYKPIFFLKTALGLLTLLFLIPVRISSEYYSSIATVLLLGLLILTALTCLFIVLSILAKIREGNKEAWFYLISIAALLFFGLAEVFVHAGSRELPDFYLAAFGIQTGLIVEAIILTFGLAYRFNSYRLDREELLVTLNRKQHEITADMIDTQENERRKISAQLHDDVGALLSVASWQISSVLDAKEYGNGRAQQKLEKAGEVLQEVAQTIRTLGHTLSPWAIQKYGLNKGITDLVYHINLSEKIILEYTIIGFEKSKNYQIHVLNDLYRIIQELLNNVLKHACASNAYLELIEHENSINILVEDNGKGIDPEANSFSEGIGLDSIRSKIAAFSGTIEILRKPEHGTIVVIEIPTERLP